MNDNIRPQVSTYKITFLFFSCIFSVANLYAQWDFKTDYLKIRVNKMGYITSLKNIFKETQPEFSPADKPSPLMCLYNSIKDVYYYPSAANFVASTNTITLKYTNGSVAKVSIRVFPKYIKLSLVSLKNRNGVNRIQWGYYHTSITNLLGNMIGVARDTSAAVNFAIGVFSLSNSTSSGPANILGDNPPITYLIHSPDPARFPLPTNLHEGQILNTGGDANTDMGFYTHGEEYYQFTGGQASGCGAATVDIKGQISVVQHAEDRRKTELIYFSLYPGAPDVVWQPFHIERQAVPNVDVIGSSVALWGSPDSTALIDVLQTIVKSAHLPYMECKGVPFKTSTNKWLKDPARWRPDVFWTGGNMDSALSYTQQLGFQDIQAENLGEFYPNPADGTNTGKLLPFSTGKRTIKSFTDVSNPLGISLGLHTLMLYLTDKNIDVTPVANAGLAYNVHKILTKNISAADEEIYINDALYLEEKCHNCSQTFRIDGELIYYSGVTNTAPYKLLGVKRGFQKTMPTAHAAGDSVFRLAQTSYNGYYPDIFLQDAYAAYYAKLMVANGMNYICFDGEEFIAGGNGTYAYKRFYRKLKEELQKLGVPYFKRMASTLVEGDWLYAGTTNVGGGFDPRTRRFNSIEGDNLRQVFYNNYCPITFATGGNFSATDVQQTYENLEATTVGMGASYMLGLNQKEVENNPNKNAIFKSIKGWEHARTANAFSFKTKQQLFDVNRQFHLVENDADTWTLYEVVNGVNIFSETLKRDKVDGY